MSVQRFLDISLAQSHAAELADGTLQTFMERLPVDSVGIDNVNDWPSQPSLTGSGFGG